LPVEKRRSVPVSTRKSIPTHCGTVLPHIYSKTVRICGPFRFCWGIAIWKRLPSISIFHSST
jgi:hypothetical protein